ncbi:unnamed protein product [Ectocarpus sp. 8 AP-2014]
MLHERFAGCVGRGGLPRSGGGGGTFACFMLYEVLLVVDGWRCCCCCCVSESLPFSLHSVLYMCETNRRRLGDCPLFIYMPACVFLSVFLSCDRCMQQKKRKLGSDDDKQTGFLFAASFCCHLNATISGRSIILSSKQSFLLCWASKVLVTVHDVPSLLTNPLTFAPRFVPCGGKQAASIPGTRF